MESWITLGRAALADGEGAVLMDGEFSGIQVLPMRAILRWRWSDGSAARVE
jgi:hypothetical protein